MKDRSKIGILFLFFIFLQCNSLKQTDKCSKIEVISLGNLFPNSVYLSEITDTILYYPLSLKENERLTIDESNIYNCVKTDSFLILLAKSRGFVYNLFSGESSHIICNQQGCPLGEPRFFIPYGNLDIVNRNGEIMGVGYHEAGNKRKCYYNLYDVSTGDLTKTFTVPCENHLSLYSFFNDSLLLGYNLFGLSVFNMEGEILKDYSYPKIRFGSSSKFYSKASSSIFMSQIGNNMYIFNNLQDTVYCMDETLELEPAFVFDLGDKKIPSDIKQKIFARDMEFSLEEISDSYYCLGNFFMSAKYLFADLIYKGNYTHILYDFENRASYLLPISIPLEDHLAKMNPERSGLINDLDGGLSFWPRSIINEGSLLTIFRVDELNQQLAHTDISLIKDRNAYTRLKQMISDLDEENTLIVMEIKLKS